MKKIYVCLAVLLVSQIISGQQYFDTVLRAVILSGRGDAAQAARLLAETGETSKDAGLLNVRGDIYLKAGMPREAKVDFMPTDNETYLSVRGQISLNVAKRELSINGTFDVDDKIYDGTTSATISQNSLQLQGVVETDEVFLSPAVEFINKNVAESKTVYISEETLLTGNSSSNYTLSLNNSPASSASITPKELMVTNAVAKDKVYDGNSIASIEGASLSGLINTDDVSLVNGNIGEFEQKDVGDNLNVSTSMEVTGADSGNYTLSQPNNLTASIEKLSVTVEGATALDKFYDGTTNAHIVNANVSGIISGDDAILSNHNSGTFSTENVGTGIEVSTSITLEGADATNYTFEQPQLAASILSKELKIVGSFTVADKEYDGNTNATIVENNLTLNGVTNNDLISLQDVTASFDTPEIGENKAVTISAAHIAGDNSSNYTLTFEDSPTTTATIFSPTVYYTLSISIEGEGDVIVNSESRYAG